MKFSSDKFQNQLKPECLGLKFRKDKDEEVFQHDFYNNKVPFIHGMLMTTLTFATFLFVAFAWTHKTLLNIEHEQDMEYEEQGLFDQVPADMLAERKAAFVAFNVINSILLFFNLLLVISAGLKLAWIDRKAISLDLRRISNKFKKD